MKPVYWIASSQKDLKDFPREAQRHIGFALHFAQMGDKHPSAKPLQGFGDTSVLEVVEDYDGDTYRAVYTVRFAEVVYVLHAFQKKSKHGIATPKRDIDLIGTRLKQAQEEYKQWLKAGKP
jgi:phage-related protein